MESPTIPKGNRFLKATVWVNIIPMLMQLACLCSIIASFFSHPHAVNEQPSDLTRFLIQLMVTACLIGLMCYPLGFVMMCIALFKRRFREKWFFWFAIIYSTLLIALPIIGTLGGLILLIYTINHSQEFDSHRTTTSLTETLSPDPKLHRKIKIAYLCISAWIFIPIIITIIGAIAASLLNVKHSNGSVEPYFVSGIDIAPIFLTFQFIGWLNLLTLPTGIVMLVIATIVYAVNKLKANR